MEMVNNIIDFIFPKSSIISGKPLDEFNSNNYLSEDEISLLKTVTSSDLADLSNKLISDHSFSHFAFYEGDNFSKIIYQLKYGGMKKLGVFMGELLGKKLEEYFLNSDLPEFDYIIPVPLFKTKYRERGYNQADYICSGLSKVLHTGFRNDIIKRIRHTKSQTMLNRDERMENVKGAFVFNEKYSYEISGKKVIIVDDVATTGSTINEVIKVIRQYTKSEVMGCTLAMARDWARVYGVYGVYVVYRVYRVLKNSKELVDSITSDI